MTPISKRLQTFIDYKDINTPAFSQILGFSAPEKIYRLFREKEKSANPSVEMIECLAQKFPELNLNWLFTGNGEMLSFVDHDRETQFITIQVERTALFELITKNGMLPPFSKE